MDKQHTKEQINLIALWAFCESGLGGVLHAVKLPFTGFFVGGFACIILMLLAQQYKHKPYQLLNATLIVIAIKFMVSPQAPFPAYIAVGFQGLLAWLVFSTLGRNIFTCIFFGGIALLESALQKFLLTTIIYGKSVWEALDIFAKGLLKDFHLSPDFSFSYWIIVSYASLYFVWGLFLGYKTFYLPQKLQKIAGSLPRFEPNSVTENKKTKTIHLKWLSLLLTIVFIGGMFWLVDGTLHKGVYVLLRTVLVLFLLLFVLNPLLRLLLQKITKKMSHDNLFTLVSTQMQSFAETVQSVWKYSQIKTRQWQRVWFFMEVLLAISLYPLDENKV